MRTQTLLGLILGTSTLVGCDLGTNPGTQIGTELAGCVVRSEEAVVIGEVPQGFTDTYDQAIDGAFGAFTGTLTLQVGGDEAMTFTLTQDGDPVVERLEWVNTDNTDIGGYCYDTYTVPILLGLASSGLDESIEATLRADLNGIVTVSLEIDEADLSGSAQPSGFDVADTDHVWFNASGTYDDGWTATLSFAGESTSGSGPDASVSLSQEPYGTFASE